ncbi:hypothetical protein GmHk_10G028278 [Glycine max]|nr:hypothetical protein GmHk_10G028278 [Glycine max]KAH1228254.1 hypothetical protein GmHk_10G028278 [Glycine max]KAH1228255.1 hypothetical protein GmHk_10G028278 [Glycine max]
MSFAINRNLISIFFKLDTHTHTHTHARTDDIGFMLVDLKKLGYHNDPFIMAEQARQVFYVQDPCDERIMASPPTSLPPPPSPPPPFDASPLSSAVKWTRKGLCLRWLSTRPPGAERPMVHVDMLPARPTAEFEIPEASDSRMKSKLIQTIGERWRLTRKWALAADQDGVDDIAQFCQTRRDPYWEDVLEKAQAIQKQNTAPHILSREKLQAEKTKKKLEQAAQSGSIDGVIDPPSPVRCHVKWKMARTKKTGEMTTKAAKEIAETIVTQGSFVPRGRQDVLTAAIGRPEHPGRVRAAGAGVTIKQYFGSTPRTSHSSSSLPPEELQQLTQQIRDQLEESITEKGLALPPEPLVGPSGPRVSTKRSCVDPSENDPETGDSDRCGLYIEANPNRLVALGRVYEGSTIVHNTPLLPGQVKVGVEEVKDANAPVLVPTDEWGRQLTPSLLDRHIWSSLYHNRYFTLTIPWLKLGHLTLFHEHAAVSLAKPPQKPDLEVDDPLYLMTLTIPKLFLRPYQVTWDATVFGVFNPDFPLYIKHEDLSEITHGGQCLSISVLQLWILHLTKTSIRGGNSDIYGFSSHSPFRGLGNRSLRLKVT